MAETISLDKKNPLLPAENYTELRKKGIEGIEKLGHGIWTEYNNSDPGITILEAVCYAITDLAYRTGYEIKDLLAPEQLTEETWNEIFYTAREILHNAPLNINDYRKIMIDVKGIRNAWIEPSKEYEVPLWVNYNAFRLENETDCNCTDHLPYKPCLGKLDLQAADITALTKFWDNRKISLTAEITTATEKINTIKTEISKFPKDDLTEAQKKKLGELKKELARAEKALALLNLEKRVISKDPIPSKIVELEGLYNVMLEYEENVPKDQQDEVRQLVINRLSSNRNLCEDYITVNNVEYEEMGIGASIVLEEYADPDLVLAKIFFRIYKYFTPSVPFYTLQQMMDKGYQVDEIFEGPPLKHGFIETAELEKTDLYRDIRLSDIINDIADIKGIKAITYLNLPFVESNQEDADTYFDQWVQYLREQQKIARIQPLLSQVIMCKERDFITWFTGSSKDRKPDRMLKLFNDFKTQERKYKLEETILDFPVPAGENMQLEGYYPVTYSLPMVYGVSERAELPGDATEKRKIQALQLKGFMLFFEQILKNYLAQLNNLRDLFTFDDKPENTYFTGVLASIDNTDNKEYLVEEINGFISLLVDHQKRGTNNPKQIFNDFSQVLQQIIEPPATFWKRRNIFLNHMLARFGEDLSEYENITRWLTPQNVEQRLIKDKTSILKNGEYYKISTKRGLGYNYSNAEFWNTANVSGTERRVSRLLGFRNADRRDLAPSNIVIEPAMFINEKKKEEQKTNAKGEPLSVIKFLDPDDNSKILLTSVEVQEGCCTQLLITAILENADIRRHYKFRDESSKRNRKAAGPVGNFWFELWDGPDIDSDTSTAVKLATGEKYIKQEEREKNYKRIQEVLTQINENEGLHLVEHILLRPKLDMLYNEADVIIEPRLLDICLDNCDLGKGLGEGTDRPPFRTKVTRIPAQLCYDKKPWVLEYIIKKGTVDHSFLFQNTFTDDTEPEKMKFRRYELLSKRIQDLRLAGSERDNYDIVNNADDDNTNLKYGFIIYSEEGEQLAQSLYEFPSKEAVEKFIARLIQWFGFEMDWYCDENPCDNNEDPYSFRATVVIPCWPKRLRDKTFRNLVEKTIAGQSPAHVHINVKWVDITEMQRFEKVYYDWLNEMYLNEMPSYEKANPVVEVLQTLKPCGLCEDDCA